LSTHSSVGLTQGKNIGTRRRICVSVRISSGSIVCKGIVPLVQENSVTVACSGRSVGRKNCCFSVSVCMGPSLRSLHGVVCAHCHPLRLSKSQSYAYDILPPLFSYKSNAFHFTAATAEPFRPTVSDAAPTACTIAVALAEPHLHPLNIYWNENCMEKITIGKIVKYRMPIFRKS
jgi:hypothetical protein